MTRDALLKQAAALMQARRYAEGAALCRRVLEQLPGDRDALHLLAMAAWKAGDPLRAEALFRECVTGGAPQPAVLANFGEMLRSLGRVPEAEAALREGIRVGPDYVPAWYRLGALLQGEGRSTEAAQCARRVTDLAPREPSGWELRASIEQKRNDREAAIRLCREGLRHVPGAGRLHYALGQVLRQECRFVEAVDAYEAARRHGHKTPDLYRNCAEAHLEAGNSERALASLSAGTARFPDHALLQRLRARFLWEHGVPGDPLGPLWQAVRDRPRAGALWEVLLDLLNRLGRRSEARAALAEARAKGCPFTPALAMQEAVVCAAEGDAAAATRIFTELVDSDAADAAVKLTFAAHLLSSGDPRRAEQLCAEVLRADPYSQLAWAYRGTAWQLLGDPREAWLLDYERMVIPVRVPPPGGYASTAAFFADVRTTLDALHRTHAHPIEQTVRGGTQTNGLLFRYKDPLLRQLEAQIRVAVRDAIAAFPEDPGHPFWGRRPSGAAMANDPLRFAGAWSVRLASQGFHTNHMHPEGWISSALYVSLPEEVRTGTDRAGHIQFGVPPVEMGLPLSPRRVVKPEVGMLVLFPSYMWHGTVPFTSAEPRITVAFDLQPQG